MNMKKVLIEAPILTQSGYGEHSRLVFESIKSQPGLEFHIHPLKWGATSWKSDLDPAIEAGIKRFHENLAHCNANNVQPEYDAQIHVGIPSEFEKKAKYSVMVTAGIETDRVSWSWILKTHQGIDKVIVPSHHSRNTYGGTTYEVMNQQNNTRSEIGCNCPIDVVPYPVKNIEPKDVDLNLETDFNFLNIGLLGPRKNIEQCVLWFLKEFKNDSNVGLILKTGMSKGTQLDRQNTLNAIKKIVDAEPNRKCKIYLLHGNMSEEEIHSLYVHPKIKAIITTTHGEGYGLPLFEAAYSGLPVVATDWSAHLDFLEGKVKNKKTGKEKSKKLFARVEYKLKEIDQSAVWNDILVEGSKWAYPEEISFRKQISKVKSNYGMYKSWAKTLKEQVVESHEYGKVLEQMRTAIGIESPAENNQEVMEEIEALFSSLPEE